MNVVQSNRRRALIGGSALAALVALAVPASAQSGDLMLGDRVFPESTTSTPAGDLFTGSVAGPNIYKVAAGSDTAELWVSTNDIAEGGIVAGVFADRDWLWACVGGPFGSGIAILTALDLETAEVVAQYPFPDGGFCNDIAVSPDGDVFVSDTNMADGPGRILVLENGEDELEVAYSDVAIGGIDGLAFLGDTLYANNVTTSELYRVEGEGDNLTGVTVLTLSEPIAGPDGMRALADGSGLILAENGAGRVDIVTIDGDTATITPLADGYEQSVGVTQIGDTIYVVEAKFAALFDPSIDPGPFVAHAVPLSGGM